MIRAGWSCPPSPPGVAMVDPVVAHRWGWRAGFVGLAAVFWFLRILPLDTLPQGWPGPDLLLALTFAWVIRRPDYVPAPLIATVFLLEDMLSQRPPGLWAALVLLGSEFLRGRIALLRGRPFLAEWAMVAAVGAGMMLAQRLVLATLFVPQAGLGAEVVRLLATLALYPPLAFLSRLAFDRAPDAEARRS